MYGLELLLFILKGVFVMLIMNLWLFVGFCNGFVGIVVDIIYKIFY